MDHHHLYFDYLQLHYLLVFLGARWIPQWPLAYNGNPNRNYLIFRLFLKDIHQGANAEYLENDVADAAQKAVRWWGIRLTGDRDVPGISATVMGVLPRIR